MKRKKSILGIAAWFLFTVLVVGAIGQTIGAMITVIPQSSWVMEGLISGCIVVAVICVLAVARMVAVNIQKKMVLTGKKSVILEIIAVLLLLSVAILSRMYYLGTIDGNQADSIYFQTASVGTDKLLFATTNHSAVIYVSILSFLLALLGNKISICILFQMVLQCITLLLVYFTIRGISGKVTAFVAAFVLAVSETYLNSMLPLSPENLLFCVFMLGFWMSSLLWKYMNGNQTTKVLDTIVFFMAGFSTAAIIYIDLTGLALFIMTISGIYISNRNTSKSVLKPMLQTVYYILGSIGGVAALFEIETIICKESFLRVAEQYIEPWLAFTIHNTYIFPSAILEVSIIIILVAGIWCVRYWQADHDENIMYIIMLAAAVCINIFFKTDIDYQILLESAWIFIASASLKSFCIRYGKRTENKTDIILLSNLSIKNDKRQNDLQGKPNLIPNPLPLPKQHERKEMNYAFLPDESMMHYDIEVIQENDNFDIE